MKSVCAKHEQAYEDSCPYCEKKAEGPTAAPAAPLTCTLRIPMTNLPCGKIAMWRWSPATPDTIKLFPDRTFLYCDEHHLLDINGYPDWKKEKLP